MKGDDLLKKSAGLRRQILDEGPHMGLGGAITAMLSQLERECTERGQEISRLRQRLESEAEPAKPAKPILKG
jgi:hypothetical protein